MLILKCWKTKNDKLIKALFYENKNGRFLLTFDKFAIISLCNGNTYKTLAEGEEIRYNVFLDEEVLPE